jgi:hypothetical protein
MFMTLMRAEILRVALALVSRVVSFDVDPATDPRSRGQHFRNGVGGLMFYASQVSWRRNLLLSSWDATRGPARHDLRHALSELNEADVFKPAKSLASRPAGAVLLAASVGALWGAARTRR